VHPSNLNNVRKEWLRGSESKMAIGEDNTCILEDIESGWNALISQLLPVDGFKRWTKIVGMNQSHDYFRVEIDCPLVKSHPVGVARENIRDEGWRARAARVTHHPPAGAYRANEDDARVEFVNVTGSTLIEDRGHHH